MTVKGFDTVMGRLQEQCYVLIDDFVYQRDRFGRRYGWGVAEYATPEKWMGEDFIGRVYRNDPAKSRAILFDRLRELCPRADAKSLQRFLK